MRQGAWGGNSRGQKKLPRQRRGHRKLNLNRTTHGDRVTIVVRGYLRPLQALGIPFVFRPRDILS